LASLRSIRDFVAVLALGCGLASAQTLTGSITGTVRDEQGLVLVGATLSLYGPKGTITAVADGNGSYRFPAVDPGTYAVQVAMPRFQPQRREDLTITIGRQLTVDFVLKISTLSEEIDVIPESALVDVRSSASTQSLPQDVLFNLPLARGDSGQLINYAPGINGGSAFGGASGFQASANAFYLDGVSTRNPGRGGNSVLLNYNTLEEVQVAGLGAPAEYGGFRGAVVNYVSRSGANRFSGLLDGQYSSKALAGDNLKADIVSQNPLLLNSSRTDKRVDVTTQLGGPIVKDKLFFFVSAQRNEVRTGVPGPVKQSSDTSPRFFGKLTWQAGGKDALTALFQWRNSEGTGLSGNTPDVATTDALSMNEHTQDRLWSLQWRRVLGTHTFLEAKYHGVTAQLNLDPKVEKPLHFDVVTGNYSGGGGFFLHVQRKQQTLHAALSHHADSFLGRHDFKFGVEFERSEVSFSTGYTGGLLYYDYAGAPYHAYSFSAHTIADNHRESFYLQDAWRVSDRLTLNPGVRVDLMRGGDRNLSHTLYEANPISPRLGVALDLTGDHKTALKAFYGQYYEAILVTYYNELLPGRTDFVTYDVTGAAPVEIDRLPLSNVTYRMDPEIRHPKVEEWSVGFDRALAGDLRFSAIGVLRTDKNFIASLYPSARWTPTVVPNGLTNGSLTVYNWANRAASESDHLITNPDGYLYLDPSGRPLGAACACARYRGLILSLDRRLKERWQAKVSYVLAKNEGTVDPNSEETIGASGSLFETPTLGLVNSYGEFGPSRRHELKLFGTYQIPRIDVNLSAHYRLISGETYTYSQLYPQQINFPSFLGRQPLIEQRGRHRYPAENLLDVRIEKVLKVHRGQIGVYADISNLFDAAQINGVQTRVPALAVEGVNLPAGTPTSLVAPRQVTLAARWSF
jgi:hypothetical protein